MTLQDELAQSLKDSGMSVVPETYLQPGKVDASDEGDLSVDVTSLRFKGYRRVWDTLTGRMALQPWWLLWQTMQKKREDGSQVFTLEDPHIPPDYGLDLKCPLHVDSPEWPELKSMGFKSCKRIHVPHQDARERHLRSSHKSAYQAIQRLREDRQREEDRQLQKDMLQALTGAAARGVQVDNSTAGVQADQGAFEPIVNDTITTNESVTVDSGTVGTDTSHADTFTWSEIQRPTPTTLPQVIDLTPPKEFSSSCERCGKTYKGSTRKQARGKVKSHLKRCS
jgi:hypothetical protein